MQATLHHPVVEHRDSQSSPTRPTAEGNHDHHDDDEDGLRPAPSTKPEAHQREAAVEGLISLSQLPPRMLPSPPLRPLPRRKRKSPPLHGPPQRQRQRHHQQGARPGQPNLPSDTSPYPSAAARAPAFTPAVRSPPPPPPLPALDRVVAPYLTRIGAPTSPPPRPSSTTTTTTTMVTPLMAPLLPPLKRLRSIATARPAPGLLAPGAIPSTSSSTTPTAPTTTAAPAAIAPASTTATPHEALRTASVAFLDGHHVALPPPQPSSSPPPTSSSSLALPSRGEETTRHLLRGSRRRRRRPRDEDYEDSEYDQDYQDDDDDDDEEEEEDDDEALMINTHAATAPQLPGLAAGFGGGGGGEDEEAGAEERERRAVERCLDLGVERNVVEALSTAGVSAERIVELILSEDKEQREGIIRGTGLSKNYIMKLQRRALRTSAHLQLPSPLAHSFRSGLVLHVLFDSHDRALFIKKELCRLLNMKGTTFSYWKKKAGVSDIDTSQDFRLMDKCRSIFGGRSTYTLYSAEQMLTILQCMQRSRQKNCFTNVPELTALIASYHPHAQPQHQRPHRYPSSTLLPALAGQPHHDSGGLPPAINDAADDDDHDQLHDQHQQREEKKEEKQEARATASAAAAACPAADLFSGRTATPSPPSPALLTTPPAAFSGPASDKGHYTAADPR